MRCHDAAFLFMFAYNMEKEQKVFKLEGKVRHYAWGGSSFIPELLHTANPDHRPFAEYWLGAHDNAPAALAGGEGRVIPLNEYVHAHPESTLGPYTAGRFGRLP